MSIYITGNVVIQFMSLSSHRELSLYPSPDKGAEYTRLSQRAAKANQKTLIRWQSAALRSKKAPVWFFDLHQSSNLWGGKIKPTKS